MSTKRHFEISFLYNPFYMFCITIIYLIVSTSIFMIIAVSYRLHAFIFLLIIAWIMPFIFRKKIMTICSKSATFEIDTQKLVVTIYNIKTTLIEKEYSILYSSLKNYSIYNSTKYNAASISLYNIEGEKYSFNIELVKNMGKASEISEAVFNGIKSYNSSKNELAEKISYHPSFLSRKSGKLLLAIVGIGWAILTICVLIYKPKISVALILGGIFFYMTILIQQKADLRQLKKSQE